MSFSQQFESLNDRKEIFNLNVILEEKLNQQVK